MGIAGKLKFFYDMKGDPDEKIIHYRHGICTGAHGL